MSRGIVFLGGALLVVGFFLGVSWWGCGLGILGGVVLLYGVNR